MYSHSQGYPVLVFVHGGGFSMDCANTYGDIEICRHLVTKGVVVVTVEYRLGYLGFWSTGDDVCPGNLGLWDQTAALQWVQDNIGAFGGNKCPEVNKLLRVSKNLQRIQNNVTIFGQSAGGASVDLLSLSPHSYHLFHKVGILAGCANATWAIANKLVPRCRLKAKKLGVESEDSKEIIEGLQKLAAKDIVHPLTLEEKGREDDLECSPIIDGDFLPGPIHELRKKAPSKPVIIGLAKNEGAFFVIKAKPKMTSVKRLIRRILNVEEGEKEEIVDEFVQLYNIDPTEEKKEKIFHAYEMVNSDYCENYPIYETIHDILNTHEATPLYSYRFDYFNPASLGLLRFIAKVKEASHCAELPYIFGKGIFGPFHFNHDDMKILDLFTTAFTNFAKYSNPNGDGSEGTRLPYGVVWDVTKRDNPDVHLTVDLESKMNSVYFDGRPKRYLEEKRKRLSHI